MIDRSHYYHETGFSRKQEMKIFLNRSVTDLSYNLRSMKTRTFVVLLAVVLGFWPSLGLSAPSTPSAKPKRALVISLDGLDFRYLKDADSYGLIIPNLRRLMTNGISTGVYGTFPSLTYPAHTTIITGVEPDRHQIFGNSAIEPLDRRTGNLEFYATAIKADTLWDAARRQGLKVGTVSWPVSLGAGDFNVPEIFKGGNKAIQNLALTKTLTQPSGLWDEVAAHDSALYAHMTADEQDDLRSRLAEYIIEFKKPELMFVHLFDFDHFQHDVGPFKHESMAILEKLDSYVGRMLAAAERAGTLDETTVFIVSDHGFLPIKWQINPGVALVRAGLITTREERYSNGDIRSVVTDWKVMPFVTSASCALILKDPNDRESARKALTAMRELAAEDRDGKPSRPDNLFMILTPAQIRARHSNTRAALMLEAKEGYSFGGSLNGAAVVESKQLGQHGYFPERYEASFIASGAGVTGRGSRPQVRMVQIGPTVARVLRLRLRDARSRPISLR
jgi:predicted AlkP superfamily pyrophosphatase or phosphodiesterase